MSGMIRFAFAMMLAAPSAACCAALGAWGVDLAAMDPAVKPGDDFSAYANGRWSKRATIAADNVKAGSFTTLTDQADRDVREIAEQAMARTANRAARQIGDLYASWMDAARIEAKGLSPLKSYVDRVTAAKTAHDIVTLFTMPGYASPIAIDTFVHPSDPQHYVVTIGQGDLALPRDYYLNAGAKYDAFRSAYRAYVTRIGILAGLADPAGRADRIIALESSLAADQWPPARRRDARQWINPMSVAQLQRLAPTIDWGSMIARRGLKDVTRVIAREPSAIAAAARQVAATPVPVWQEYLVFRFISDHARFLPRAFDDAHFQFFGRTVADQPAQPERWKRGVRLLNRELGEAVGEIYVARHYSSETRRQMAELIEDLRAAYGELIDKAGWMDAPTKAEARAKLAMFEARIGHPVKYVDYSQLEVRRDDLLGNAVRAERFRWQLTLKRYARPVDRTLWTMNPQEVDAYYARAMNQITFPAAVLQPPFFDVAADPAVNYGAIGAVIGHEMGHGFDDQGRQFDGRGVRRDWWSQRSADRYTRSADALARQYGEYEPVPGVRIDGRLTLGENLADLGGIEAAYAAYRRYVGRHGEAARRDGFTADQRFFLGYAQVWQAKRREGFNRQALLTDPHSPEDYRINGVVRNVDAWYAAFGVKPGDALYLPPADRVRIW